MIMLNRRRVMVSKAFPYDSEIEYLQWDKGAYINTGKKVLFGLSDFEIDAIVSTTDNSHYGSLLGNRSAPANADGFSLYLNSAIRNDIIVSLPKIENHIDVTSVNWYNGNFHNIKVNVSRTSKTNNIVCTIDNNVFYKSNSSNMTCDRENIRYTIFRNADSSMFFKGKIKHLKVVVGNNLFFDFIPVRVGNIGYLYDKVSGQLFGNAGTGSFILGQDK